MNDEMSTTKEIIWEEKNLIEPLPKLENSGKLDVCDTTTNINEKLEKKTLNDTTKISGIYKIVNKVNGKYYVGSSNNIYKRWLHHKRDLNNNRHHNIHLQRAWNKYGKENFDFIIEKNIPENLLGIEEQIYLNSLNNKVMYNISDNSSLSIEQRKKSFKISERMLGKNNPMYGKIGANKGKSFSLETKKRMSKNNCKFWLNKKRSEETKQKMRNSSPKERLGKHHTNEVKQKLSTSHRDKTIYYFKNKNTNETFSGMSYDFAKKFGLIPLSVRKLVFGKMKTLYGWFVNEKEEFVPIEQI